MTGVLASEAPNLQLLSLPGTDTGIAADVLAGLGAVPKRLPPKLFYDATGAGLFQAICGTQAYYPTRLETEILGRCADDLARALGPGTTVIEPGAGEMRKIRLLLPALKPRAYFAVDVSEGQLFDEAGCLAEEYPQLMVTALAGDFADPRVQRQLAAASPPRVLFFPGSTLGNFEPGAARDFLRAMRAVTSPSGACLIGIDLVKSRAVLERAYDDPEGITARFNLNLLVRINRELGADFDVSAFAHRAFYDARQQRIEMHLVSARAQRVRVCGRTISFAAGETIHTENSYKYQPAQFESLAREAGFPEACRWSDPLEHFAVFLLR